MRDVESTGVQGDARRVIDESLDFDPGDRCRDLHRFRFVHATTVATVSDGIKLKSSGPNSSPGKETKAGSESRPLFRLHANSKTGNAASEDMPRRINGAGAILGEDEMQIRALMVAAAAAIGLAVSPAVAAQVKITMIIYTAPGVPFFNPLIKGAQDAAKQADVNLNIQYANNDQVLQNNITQTAIASKVDGIATIIWDDHAFKKTICDAVHHGIPVIAFNIDNTKGAAGSCRLAFIGQDFVDAGYLIGKRMVEAAHLKKGDLVFTPVEFPDAAYATLRHQGVQKALDEVGARSEIIGTGGNLPEVRTKMVQYLIGHSDVKAIIGLGEQPMIEAIPSLKEAKLNVPVGGFDVSKEILDGIAKGNIVATVDQQPYSQGYFAVLQLALDIRYGLYPSDMKTGGRGLVDKSNYNFAVKWAGTYR